MDTPNLDGLANAGVRFDRAYATCPICSPFRASLYTGQYIHRHGVTSLHRPLLSRPQLAEALQAAGYLTSHVGKWHLAGGAAPQSFVSPYFRPGWERWRGWENSNEFFNPQWHRGSHPGDRGRIEGYMTDGLTDWTIDFLKERAIDTEDTRPWFHVLSTEPPHNPHIAPEEDMAAYATRPLTWRENVPEDPEWRAKMEPLMRGYYAQIANLDRNVGRILDALEQTGAAENTIVFYLSDHGELLGSHRRTTKSRPEEESCRIPLIVRGPGIPGGRRSEALISAVDLMPTVLGLAGVVPPDTVQGTDLSRLVRGDETRGADTVLLQFDSNFWDPQPDWQFRSVVTDQWVYTHSPIHGPWQLFDLKKDPYQLDNRVADPAAAEQRAHLHATLKARLEAVGDPYAEKL